MNSPRFKDRIHAGQLLALQLARYAKREDVVVVGLPSAGMRVAFEVSRLLQVPLDVLVIGRLGVPGHEELTMGEITSGGLRVINEMMIWNQGLPLEKVDKAAAGELQTLLRKETAYRGHQAAANLKDRVVILVDEGIATGSMMQAAVKALREQAPAHLVVAVPVAPPTVCSWLEGLVDEVVCLVMPEEFGDVGFWYEEDSPTSDEDVAQLIQHARSLNWHTGKHPIQPRSA